VFKVNGYCSVLCDVVCLGVSLDFTVSYREHLPCTAAKLKSRNNSVLKLAGTSWDESARSLHTSGAKNIFDVPAVKYADVLLFQSDWN